MRIFIGVVLLWIAFEIYHYFRFRLDLWCLRRTLKEMQEKIVEPDPFQLRGVQYRFFTNKTQILICGGCGASVVPRYYGQFDLCPFCYSKNWKTK